MDGSYDIKLLENKLKSLNRNTKNDMMINYALKHKNNKDNSLKKLSNELYKNESKLNY